MPFITGGNVIWGALVGLFVPREFLGRVTALDWLFTLGLIPLAYATVGPVSDAIGIDKTLLIAGVVAGTLPLLFLVFLPSIQTTGDGDSGDAAYHRPQVPARARGPTASRSRG